MPFHRCLLPAVQLSPSWSYSHARYFSEPVDKTNDEYAQWIAILRGSLCLSEMHKGKKVPIYFDTETNRLSTKRKVLL